MDKFIKKNFFSLFGRWGGEGGVGGKNALEQKLQEIS